MSGSEFFQGAGYIGNQIQEATDRALRSSSAAAQSAAVAEVLNLKIEGLSGKYRSLAPLKARYVEVALTTTPLKVAHGLYNRWGGFLVLWTTGTVAVYYSDTTAHNPGKEIPLQSTANCTAGILVIPEWRALRPGET